MDVINKEISYCFPPASYWFPPGPCLPEDPQRGRWHPTGTATPAVLARQSGTSSHCCTRQRKAEPSSTFLACCKSSLPSPTFVFFLELGVKREAGTRSGGAPERQRAQRSGRPKAAHRPAGAVLARTGAHGDLRARTRKNEAKNTSCFFSTFFHHKTSLLPAQAHLALAGCWCSMAAWHVGEVLDGAWDNLSPSLPSTSPWLLGARGDGTVDLTW